MHIRTWCYAVLCLFLPITLPAQKEHKYLDHALPEAWQENDSDFQQTLPVDDQWWKNFNDPTLDSLIEVKSRKTKSDGREKRKAIFEAKTKCAQKSRLLPPSGQNTSVVQTPFKSCLNDAFLLNFLLKYHLKPIANLAKNRIFT